MNVNPNTHRDMQTTNEHSKSDGIDIVQPAEFLEKLDALNDVLAHNQPVTRKMIDDVRNAMSRLTVIVGGEEMTVQEARQIPDLQKNIPIWKEVLQGNFDNSLFMTALTKTVAKAIAESTIPAISLNHVVRMTDEQAAILTTFKGDIISMSGLLDITDEQANILAPKRAVFFCNTAIERKMKEAASRLGLL